MGRSGGNWRQVDLGWCGGKEICLWDIERGELLQTVNIGSYFLTLSLRISEDGSKIFLLDDKSIRAWSIQTAKIAGEVEFVGKPFFNSLVLDDSKVWVRFEDSQSQGWDFGLVGSLIPPVPLSSSSAPPALRPPSGFYRSYRGLAHRTVQDRGCGHRRRGLSTERDIQET